MVYGSILIKLLQMNITFLFTFFLLTASIQAQDSTDALPQDPVNQAQNSTDAPFSLDRALLSTVSREREITTTVRDLLNYGANVHTTTDDQNTSLHLAAQRGTCRYRSDAFRKRSRCQCS